MFDFVPTASMYSSAVVPMAVCACLTYAASSTVLSSMSLLKRPKGVSHPSTPRKEYLILKPRSSRESWQRQSIRPVTNRDVPSAVIENRR